MRAAFGNHRQRAIHARGVVLAGSFEPTKDACELTTAPHLQRTKSAVLLRFSDFTGIPDIPQNIGAANPRGFALRFTMPDHFVTDIVGHSFDGFPVKTSDDFCELLLAIAASGPETLRPTALERFLEAHPVARRFLTTQTTPASYATVPYFGVNAFRFTNDRGTSCHVRYRFAPEAGEHTLTATEATARGSSYLHDELVERIAKQPVRFMMVAQLAAANDVLDDPSIAWPATRPTVALGMLTLTALAPGDLERTLAFDPMTIPHGIEAPDPMLKFRSRSYGISVEERR